MSSVPEAFDSFLAKGGKYYEPKADTPIVEAVATIRRGRRGGGVGAPLGPDAR